MDVSEAKRLVFSRIQALDSENACRIMGHLMNLGHLANDQEMIRLALGPDSLLQSLIHKSNEELDRLSDASKGQSSGKSKLMASPTGKGVCSQQHTASHSSGVISVGSSSEEEKDEACFSEEDWNIEEFELKNEELMAQIAQIESDEMLARCLQEEINGEFHDSEGTQEQMAQHDTESNITSFERHGSEPNQVNRSIEPLYLNGQYFTLQVSPLENPNRRSIETRFSGPEMEYEMWLLSEVRKGLNGSQMDPDRKAELLKELETLYENRDNVDVPNSSYAGFYDDMYEDGDLDELLGATDRQINNLPEYTVQGDKLEDICAICLEAPSVGAVVRHLPCMHKLHKECIDTWLRIRDFCPICKMSIK